MIGSYQVHKLMIPTVFVKAAQCVIEEAHKISADAVLCIGQAGGRSKITPEYYGLNLRNASIPDNDGNQPVFEKIIKDGPEGLLATLDVRNIAAKIAEKYPAEVSFYAGTFVCNETLYTVLEHFNGTDVKAGFIHVPYIPEQASDNEPSMPLEDIIAAITIAIENI